MDKNHVYSIAIIFMITMANISMSYFFSSTHLEIAKEIKKMREFCGVEQ